MRWRRYYGPTTHILVFCKYADNLQIHDNWKDTR